MSGFMITLVSIDMLSNNILMNKISYVSIMIWNDLQVACNFFFINIIFIMVILI